MLKFYNINNKKLESFKKILNLFCIIKNLRTIEENKKLIYWYNFLSSKTIDELYETLIPEDKELIIKEDTYRKYIVQYFYLKRNLLIREKILYTNYKSMKEFDLFFNKFKDELYNKYEINKNTEQILLNITQDKYLIKYYNIVKKKLTKNN